MGKLDETWTTVGVRWFHIIEGFTCVNLVMMKKIKVSNIGAEHGFEPMRSYPFTGEIYRFNSYCSQAIRGGWWL